MSGTDASNPALPGPATTETTRVPGPGGKRRPGAFEKVETRAPDRGRSLEEGLAELKRRRAGGAAAPGRQRRKAETYIAPDGSRIAIPAGGATPSPVAATPPPVAAAPPPVAAAPPPVDMAAALTAAGITLPGAPAAQPVPVAPPPPVSAAATLPAGTVPVTIDGKVEQISLNELVQGYLRNQDYSRKTQQTAGQLRQAQEAQAQFNTARERLEQRLAAMLAVDGDEFARPIDWVTLSKTDPIGYSQKHARFLARQEMLAEHQRLAEVRQREETGRKQYALQTGHQALCQIVPGWSDATTRGQLQAKMLQHLRWRGFLDDEIARREMIDPRDVIILLESMLWAAHITQGTALPTPTPAVPTMPGNGRDATARGGNGFAPGGMPADVAALDDRFSRTRKLDDAVSLLQARRAAVGRA